MSGYPEDMPARGVCVAEGYEWAGGSQCIRCGERLRCWCGRYTRADKLDKHLPTCRTILRWFASSCDCGHPYEWHTTGGRCRQRSVAGIRCQCDA